MHKEKENKLAQTACFNTMLIEEGIFKRTCTLDKCVRLCANDTRDKRRKTTRK